MLPKDWLGLHAEYAVAPEEVTTLSQLHFGDMIEAKAGAYFFDAGELGMGTVLMDLRKVSGPPPYSQSISQWPAFNRSGLLLQYEDGSGKSLKLFNDRTLYFLDTRTAVHSTVTGHSLSESEIQALLRSLAGSGFDGLPDANDDSLLGVGRIMLACARFQVVRLAGHETELQPAITKLNALISRLESRLVLRIRYDRKRPLGIKPWPVPDIPLALLPQLREEADAHFRRTKQILETSTVYRTLLSSLLDELPRSATPRDILESVRFFTEEGKLYSVGIGTNKCTAGPSSCKPSTFYMLHVLALSEADSATPVRGVPSWPRDSSLELAPIPNEGAALEDNEYQAHRAFYDRILARGPLGWVIQDGWLFEQVRVYKTE